MTVPIAIVGARVFDGRTKQPWTAVRIVGGRIDAVGDEGIVHGGDLRVDAAGCTPCFLA